MRFDILTLFPEMFTGVLGSSILKRAAEKKLVSYHLHQLRDFSKDPHKKVDDRPFGGGPGMVLMCQPVIDAVAAIETQDSSPATRVILAPTGERFSQRIAEELSKLPRLLLIAGHYEGFDERIHEILQPREISIGDYVLSGGEIPAMTVLDAVVRLLPGVLGDEASPHGESFGSADATINGGLEYPHYTRPREFQGRGVPEILFSGNHGAVEAWRREQAKKRTAERRPDLIPPAPPGSQDGR
ncbi:MAG TPA: tRNA (guanosine(37)-N1)-methyltransferase TrmD [Phycisphaerae bacterium]|nr:tRNA (guanosine(37)-N1)-methyltransferase TrmD [Phycisphaerae bacterium]